MEKRYSNLLGSMWKCNRALNLKTGCATLGGNNCSHVLVITGNESFTLPWRNLFFAEMF